MTPLHGNSEQLIEKVGYKYRVEGYDGLHLSECMVVFWPDRGYECTCDDWGPE